MFSKKLDNPRLLFSSIKDGSSIMSGGFGLCGIPENCIDLLEKFGPKNLTVISNNIGNSGRGLVKLLKKNMISKAVCSYVGGNPDLEERILNRSIEVSIMPQGTFIEKIRSAGAGIPAFYTKAGTDTEVELGKETKIFGQQKYILEEAIHADYAIIKASIGDEFGNIYFKEASRNFSPLMAMAAKTTIVEVEKLVKIGEIPPDQIHLPGVFVQHIFQGNSYKNEIEYLIEEES